MLFKSKKPSLNSIQVNVCIPVKKKKLNICTFKAHCWSVQSKLCKLENPLFINVQATDKIMNKHIRCVFSKNKYIKAD